MSSEALSLALPVLEIIWINLLLSGDNAVVIALACRALPGRQRMIGIVLGAGAAILMRIAFTLVTTQLIMLPWLKAGGAIALLWIASQLLVSEDEDNDIAGHTSLWKAVWTVTAADIVMSLDNVIAIAAAARGNASLIVFGLALSIPLVIVGSSLLVRLVNRFPWLVWAGAALLGWIAGELFATDAAIFRLTGGNLPELVCGIGGTVIVLTVAITLRKRQPNTASSPP